MTTYTQQTTSLANTTSLVARTELTEAQVSKRFGPAGSTSKEAGRASVGKASGWYFRDLETGEVWALYTRPGGALYLGSNTGNPASTRAFMQWVRAAVA